MIVTLRALFLGSALRLKLAVVAVLAVLVMIWVSSFSSAASRFWRAQRNTAAALKVQADYLNNRAAIEQAAQRAASQLEPARTLDAQHLFTTIQQIATEAGLNSKLTEEPATPARTNGSLSVYQLRFRINNADWDALKRFYVGLHQRSPYIALNQLAMQPNRANPNQASITATVSSVEIPR